MSRYRKSRIAAAVIAIAGTFSIAGAATTPAHAAALPTGLTVQASGTTTLQAKWSAVAGAKKYMVKVSSSSSWSNPVYFRPTVNSTSITGLKASTKYYVKVAIADSKGKRISDYAKPTVTASTNKSVATTSATTVPTGLKLSNGGSDVLNASWTPVSGGLRYVVKVSASSKWTSPIYFKPTTSPTKLTGLKPSTKYYVKIAQADSKGARLSNYSSTVTASTGTVSLPSGLTVSPAGTTSLSASWKAAAGASKYMVKVSASSSWSNPIYFVTSTPSGELSGLKPSTTYWVKVAVADTNGKRIGDYAKPTVSQTTKSLKRFACYNTAIYGVRGSGQEPDAYGASGTGKTGMGNQAELVANTVQQKISALPSSSRPTIGFYYSPYEAASISRNLGNVEGAAYKSSALNGAAQVYDDLVSMTTACPTMRISVVGYSQGAEVLHAVASRVSSETSAEAAKVLAGVKNWSLISDPSRQNAAQYVTDRYWNGTPAASGLTYSSSNPKPMTSKMANKVFSYCNAKDAVCSSAASQTNWVAEHVDFYLTSSVADRIAQTAFEAIR